MKKIVSILFCLCITLVLSPKTVFAEEIVTITIGLNGIPTETSGTGWSYSNSQLTLNSGYEFIFTGNSYINSITNKGTITEGVFDGEITNNGTINGGTFNGDITNGNKGKIYGGIFHNTIKNNGGTSSNRAYIYGGFFYGEVTNVSPSYISGGTFLGAINASFGSTITDGTFYGEIKPGSNGASGAITGGTFYGNMESFLKGTGSSIKGANVKFAIKYELNNGAWINSKSVPNTYAYGTSIKLPTADDIYKYGYTFMGWYDNEKFTGIPITEISSKETGIKTFYASFVQGDVEQPIYDWEKAGNTAIEKKDYNIDENGNYIVYTALGLAKIANIVNNGENLSGKVVTLANDIDLYDGKVYGYEAGGNITTSNSWVPIDGFNGIFDGNGKKIKNLYIYADTTESIKLGLFGTNNGTIKNLTLESGNIKLNIAYSSLYNSVPPSYYIGGIVARTSGVIDNCKNYIPVNVTSDENAFQISDVYIGGIAASSTNSSVVSNCKNYGNITSSIYSSATVNGGGIVGNSSSIEKPSTNLIDNCYNEGNVKLKSNGPSYAGGIAGFVHPAAGQDIKVKIVNSGNTGIIEGMYSGGIAGFCEYNASFINNYNLGNVETSKIAGESSAGKYAGGIVGYAGKYDDLIYPSIINSYNAGSISGAEINGGIAGRLKGGSIKASYTIISPEIGIVGTQEGAITETYRFTKIKDTYIIVNENNNTKELIEMLNDWVFDNADSGYLNWKPSQENENYPVIGTIEYLIILDPNEGYLSNDTKNPITTTDGKLSYLPVPSREGYTFLGWFNGEDIVNKDTIYIANTTLKAKWSLNTEKDNNTNNDKDNSINTNNIKDTNKNTKPVDNPNTEDNILLHIILMIISISGIITTTYKLKNKYFY